MIPQLGSTAVPVVKIAHWRRRSYACRHGRLMIFAVLFFAAVLGEAQGLKMQRVEAPAYRAACGEHYSHDTRAVSGEQGQRQGTGWRWRSHAASAKRRDRALGNNKYGKCFWQPPQVEQVNIKLAAVVVPREFKADVKQMAKTKVQKAVRESQAGIAGSAHSLRTASLGAWQVGAIDSNSRGADHAMQRSRNVAEHTTSRAQRSYADALTASRVNKAIDEEEFWDTFISDDKFSVHEQIARQDLQLSLLRLLQRELGPSVAVGGQDTYFSEKVDDLERRFSTMSAAMAADVDKLEQWIGRLAGTLPPCIGHNVEKWMATPRAFDMVKEACVGPVADELDERLGWYSRALYEHQNATAESISKAFESLVKHIKALEKRLSAKEVSINNIEEELSKQAQVVNNFDRTTKRLASDGQRIDDALKAVDKKVSLCIESCSSFKNSLSLRVDSVDSLLAALEARVAEMAAQTNAGIGKCSIDIELLHARCDSLMKSSEVQTSGIHACIAERVEHFAAEFCQVERAVEKLMATCSQQREHIGKIEQNMVGHGISLKALHVRIDGAIDEVDNMFAELQSELRGGTSRVPVLVSQMSFLLDELDDIRGRCFTQSGIEYDESALAGASSARQPQEHLCSVTTTDPSAASVFRRKKEVLLS